MLLRRLSFLIPFFISFALYAQSPYSVVSPNGAVMAVVETSPSLNWQIFLRNRPLTTLAPLSLSLAEHGILGANPEVKMTDWASTDIVRRPDVRQKSATVTDQFNELTLTFKGDWGVVFRAYNEGVAYRFFTNFKGKATVLDETFAFRPILCNTIFFPEEESFYSHNERIAKRLSPADLNEHHLASLPALAELDGGVKILLTETDLQHYPGLWVLGTASKNGSLRGTFPRLPKHTVELTDRDIQPTDRTPFLAITDGTRQYPWRLMLIAEKDQQLLTNQLPWLLAAPSRLKDASWIRPGKVAWDWWNNLNVHGVDFRAGVNTATYCHFVDFAAENDLDYIILDEGWSEPGDLRRINPALDMDGLAAYSKTKNVGLILWVTWTTIDRQFDELLPNLKKWDIKGLKIDFMQRDDQQAVNFYWRMAEKCAANKLLVDFHGAHKPAGLQRTWPNVLTFEGVYGLEQAKWDDKKQIDPEHDVTLPFLRQVAGPMDYTPGAMLNYQKNDWAPSWNRPASLGTRCHELAKYIVFESPLQMLADSPTNYRKEPECLRFLSKVPVVWEKTVALDGKIGDFVAVARQAADSLWYIGAMTDWNTRELTLETDFLPKGDYEIEIYQDGPNADRCAQDYLRTIRRMKSGDKLGVKMAPGGGFVAVLRKM
ncbi:MAG: glycoside hydrolase family 97 protein [Saprospiraceae bacterium]|nr:glycoside hydrolase family 97 protein [Saprospiraceae bacterium]